MRAGADGKELSRLKVIRKIKFKDDRPKKSAGNGIGPEGAAFELPSGCCVELLWSYCGRTVELQWSYVTSTQLQKENIQWQKLS